MQVAVNGAEVKIDGKPGTYAGINREWKEGDTVEIRVPMSLRTEALPGQNPRNLAVLFGPVVLAGELGTEGLEKIDLWPHAQVDLNRVPTPSSPQLVCEPAELLGKLEPVPGSSMTYRTKGIGRPSDVTLSPLYKLHYQRYSVYWDLLTEGDWKEYEAKKAAAVAKRKAYEARIIDEVQPGEQQPETDHNMKGERTGSGDFNGRKWRDAHGWFSYEMKAAVNAPMMLHCTYWGGDGNREFDILVDGVKIATQKLGRINPSEFVDQDYVIPAELTKGRDRVTVKFQAQPGSVAGGVFGVLLLKSGAM